MPPPAVFASPPSVPVPSRTAAEAVRQAARALQDLARQLEASEAERGWSLAGIAHDLRLPLARLRLELELSIADMPTRALVAADIEEIAGLADELAAQSRALRRPRPRALALRQALEQAADPFVRRHRLTLDNDVTPDLMVRADAQSLRRVLRNLLDNAARHARPVSGDVVRVQARSQVQGSEVALTLVDEGGGVADEEWPRLAQPFFRGQQQRSQSPGRGLGLWTVRQTLQAMGGALLLSPAPGGGLQAQVRLPAAAGRSP